MARLPLDFPELPEGWTALEGTAALKCLDEHGQVSVVIRSTDRLTAWEAVGMLIFAEDSLRADLQDSIEED